MAGVDAPSYMDSVASWHPATRAVEAAVMTHACAASLQVKAASVRECSLGMNLFLLPGTVVQNLHLYYTLYFVLQGKLPPRLPPRACLYGTN